MGIRLIAITGGEGPTGVSTGAGSAAHRYTARGDDFLRLRAELHRLFGLHAVR